MIFNKLEKIVHLVGFTIEKYVCLGYIGRKVLSPCFYMPAMKRGEALELEKC
jgi:hypothetical protein